MFLLVSGETQNASKCKRVKQSALAKRKKTHLRSKQAGGKIKTQGDQSPMLRTHHWSQGVHSTTEGTITANQTDNISKGSWGVCRRVPSRENRHKRACDFLNSSLNNSLVASPMNALDDTLYFQVPPSSIQSKSMTSNNIEISQTQGATLVSYMLILIEHLSTN